MKVHTEFAQNSLEWLLARAGVVTASEFDNLVTPKWVARHGEGVKSYMNRKLAEKWIGGPLPGYSSIDMEFGQILEKEALPGFEFETGQRVDRVGFITSDDGKIGCSPDGLIGEDGGIEIKCPMPHTHVGYLLNGVVPPEYQAQVHGSIYVTGRKWWKFYSYCRRFPPLLVTVERNETLIEIIHDAVTTFLDTMEDGWNQLVLANGGPPKRPEPVSIPNPEPEYVDMMP